jgi:hypothetical protein
MTSTALPSTLMPLSSYIQQIDGLEWATLQAIAYADIFHFPLTPAEVHRYLVSHRASLKEVQSLLANGRLVPHTLARRDDYFALAGRETAFDVRRRRAEVAASLWPRAVRYGQIIGNLPFVRMVAVTGALSVDNVEPDADVDYLIVTAPGRLWLCRALVVAIVRLAARRGDPLCPNYFLSENALVLDERNLFTAHEVVQMVPLSGMSTYRRLRQLNSWTAEYLPNGDGPPRLANGTAFQTSTSKRAAEAMLRTPLFAPVEKWEMQRKVRKLNRQHPGAPEAAFSPDRCKGHFEGHGHRALDAFAERLQTLERSVR